MSIFLPENSDEDDDIRDVYTKFTDDGQDWNTVASTRGQVPPRDHTRRGTSHASISVTGISLDENPSSV